MSGKIVAIDGSQLHAALATVQDALDRGVQFVVVIGLSPKDGIFIMKSFGEPSSGVACQLAMAGSLLTNEGMGMLGVEEKEDEPSAG